MKLVPTIRIKILTLTSKGLHFGEAAWNTMGVDPLGGQLLNAAVILRKVLMDKSLELKGKS